VRGVSFGARQALASELTPGRRLLLRPEPQNPHDPGAVAVLTPAGRKLGYVPREVASRALPAGRTETWAAVRSAGRASAGGQFGVAVATTPLLQPLTAEPPPPCAAVARLTRPGGLAAAVAESTCESTRAAWEAAWAAARRDTVGSCGVCGAAEPGSAAAALAGDTGRPDGGGQAAVVPSRWSADDAGAAGVDAGPARPASPLLPSVRDAAMATAGRAPAEAAPGAVPGVDPAAGTAPGLRDAVLRSALIPDALWTYAPRWPIGAGPADPGATPVHTVRLAGLRPLCSACAGARAALSVAAPDDVGSWTTTPHARHLGLIGLLSQGEAAAYGRGRGRCWGWGPTFDGGVEGSDDDGASADPLWPAAGPDAAWRVELAPPLDAASGATAEGLGVPAEHRFEAFPGVPGLGVAVANVDAAVARSRDSSPPPPPRKPTPPTPTFDRDTPPLPGGLSEF